MFNLLKNFHEVDEKLIIHAAEVVGGENAFSQLLYRAHVFRMANTTPIYLVSQDQSICFVSCRETYNQRLH
jgi:hypothetical protein